MQRSRRPTKAIGPRILLLALLPIGDTLFALPVIQALRRRYPAASLVALAHETTAPLLHCVPAIDEVVVLPTGPDWAGIGPLLTTLSTLRVRRFDAAINLTSPAYKWISLLCGIRRRTYMKFDRLWWLLPGTHKEWRARHATEHYYDCARELDLPPWSEVDHAPRLDVLPPTATAAARAFLDQHGIGQGRHLLVGIHPGGAGLHGLKRWPASHVAALSDRLRERREMTIVLLGGPDEMAIAESVTAAMHARLVNATGALPLLTSIALIAACDLFVGNDSGLLHAAAAVGTPYVGIFGPTCPTCFQPMPTRPGQGMIVEPPRRSRCLQHFVGGAAIWSRPYCRDAADVLSSLSVDAVEECIDAVLAHNYAGPSPWRGAER